LCLVEELGEEKFGVEESVPKYKGTMELSPD
jgi:hypothetical protein